MRGVDPPALELANSLYWPGRGPHIDLLERDPAWLASFLERWGFPVIDPSPRERAKLLRLRALLRRIAEELGERRILAQNDVEELNAFLGARPLRREVVRRDGGFALEIAPAPGDWESILAEIAASFVHLLVHGDPARVKTCDNPECRFAFYDATKNRSRRWCAQTICGNRDKVRRFRARQRSRGRGQPRRQP